MFIIVYRELDRETRFVLKPGDTVAGRAEICDLRIDDPSLSRWHACFTVDGDRCSLKDVGSRNGTFVNGVQITRTDLEDGDHLFLGLVAARIEVSAEDQVAIVEPAGPAPFPFMLDRPVDQAAGAHPEIDAGRLLTLISDMAKSLVKNQPLANILDEVVRLGLESTHAERAFLILNDEKTDRWCRAWRGPGTTRRRRVRSAARCSIAW